MAAQQAQPRILRDIKNFTPSWFTVNMGTAAVAGSIAMFPYTFPGQNGIGWGVWWLNAVLFAAFSIMFGARFVLFPDSIRPMLGHSTQSMFMGAIPMAFSGITNGLPAFWVPRFGASAAYAGAVLWYANLPAVAYCAVSLVWYMFTRQSHEMHAMTALWLLPVVPMCVAANTAGLVAGAVVQAEGLAAAGKALVILGIGWALGGAGLGLAYSIITMYHQRLMLHKLPPRELVVSSFIPVGPLSMTAWAFMSIGRALEALQGAPQLDAIMGSSSVVYLLHAGTTLGALFLWSFSCWWLVVAFATVGSTMRGGLPFTLGWWGAVFPFGVWTAATITLGQRLTSSFFQGLGAAAACAHVLLWLVVASRTAHGMWTGKLFHAPCLSQANATQLQPQPPGAPAPLEGKEVQQLNRRLDEVVVQDGDDGAQVSAGSSCHQLPQL